MPAEPGRRTQCGVLGSPIAHSLSPVLHRAAYRAIGLDWQYDAHDVAQAQLAGFLAGLPPQWRGLSLTMPLKRVVLDLCDRVESRGRLLGSINTVVLDPDGTRSGYNTDVGGMVRALRAAGVHSLDTAVIVGGGATAASALGAVAELGAYAATVLVRSPQRAAELLTLAAPLHLDLAARSLSDNPSALAADVLICTIPAEAQPPVAAAVATVAPVVFDVVYAPPMTPVLAAAERHGATLVVGFELLLHQAARQVELMTGVQVAPVEAMRAAGVEDLRARSL